ncbi:hypothetical protein [Actinomadura sp. 6N118]|uniref:hypothetical protein n=1 Tax=Actinomadura sp. 6N118 TaxID=3375151 RepID=UPI0037BC2438
MAWVPVSVAMGFVGIAILAYCSFKVYLGVRRLGRELDRTRRRLEPKQSTLQDELHTLRDARETQDPEDGVRST